MQSHAFPSPTHSQSWLLCIGSKSVNWDCVMVDGNALWTLSNCWSKWIVQAMKEKGCLVLDLFCCGLTMEYCADKLMVTFGLCWVHSLEDGHRTVTSRFSCLNVLCWIVSIRLGFFSIYNYSGFPWLFLSEIKIEVSFLAEVSFSSCLLNKEILLHMTMNRRPSCQLFLKKMQFYNICHSGNCLMFIAN